MTFNQFIFKAILFNFRKYLTYFFCITFSMTVFFLFSAIWYVPNFNEQTSVGTRQIVQIGAVISGAFSIFLITYSYNHFFKSRTKEIGVLMSYGLLYRDMKRMIILENSLIFIGALFSAFISGSVFSRLFLMITMTILGINEISFVLTYKSFLLTTISFIPIYFLIVVLTIIKIRKYSVIKLIKVNRVKEMKRDGSKLLALLGLLVVVISLLFLYVYTSDFTRVDTMKKVILISLLASVSGVYLFLSNFISLLYAFWKRNERKYHKNILSFSEFASRFSQNRSVIFMICLLSMGIVFFSTLTYTLYNQSYQIAEKEQLYDVIIKDYQSVKLVDHMNVERFLAESDRQLIDKQKLNIVYLVAPEMNHTPWRTNKSVMVTSVQDYNSIFATQHEVEKGHAMVIDFNYSQHETIDYFGESISLENEQTTYSFVNQGTELKKLFDRYVFSQPILIILNVGDYQELANEASSNEIGSILMLKFDNWLETGEIVEQLKVQMEASLDVLVEKDKESIDTIERSYNMPFIVHSKYDRYVHTKQVAGFALFIMSFISILFLVTVCVILHFKIFSDQEEDKRKIKLLQTIGITATEIRMYLYKKLKMVMILPIVLGSLLGLCLSVAINLFNVAELEILNTTIFSNGLIVIILYFIFIGLYYQWLKITYRKAVE